MSKNKGYVGFDWIMPGAVSLFISERGGQSPSLQLHMTPDEAKVVARRLIAWADYKRARDARVSARQPGNHCTIKAAPLFHRV